MDADAATGGVPGSLGRGLTDVPGSLSSLPDPDGHVWLSVAVAAACVVVAAYLVSHTHPAYEGGLYARMIEAIVHDGFRLPRYVHGYTAGGVPFAYPPLLFYAIAGLVSATGVDPVTLELYLPGLVTVAYLVPYYGVARRLLPSSRQAGLATVLYAVTPAALQWHLSAGGVIRAPAMFLTLTGLYTGIRLFEDGGRRWLLASTVLFGAVVLSHPVYAAFFGLSYLLLFAFLDRSVGGLVDGALVAGGGLLLSAPWWATVVDRFGVGVLLGVDGTRSTIGGGVGRLLDVFVYPIGALDPVTPFFAAAFAGALYAVARRRYLLPAWLVVGGYGLGEDRFTFVAGAMLTSMLVFEVVVPRIESPVDRADVRRVAAGLAVAVVVVGACGVGVAYAGSDLHTLYHHSTTMPQTVSPADRQAMAWTRTHTAPDADVAVVGDQAEWFPYYTGRTILVSPWGTEWTAPDRFWRNVRGYDDLSNCRSAGCLDATLARFPGDARYVYVPTTRYRVRAKEHAPPDDLLRSLRASPRYTRRYENEGVVVFERRAE